MTTLAEVAALNREHSIFSPSSAAMWMTCKGSLVANALADDETTAEAAEGTVAHAMADWWLRRGERPTHMVGKTMEVDGHTIQIDDAMLGYVEEYVEWVQDAPGNHFYEQRIDLSRLFPIPDQGGTADHFACTWGKLTITDLKYGKGIKVYAEQNPQAMLYALGVFFEWDWWYGFDEIVIRIAQPRLDHFDTWSVSRADLLAFADLVRARAAAAWVVDAPRTPSEKACQWCKVQRTCPAYLNWFSALRDEEADVAFGVGEMEAAALSAADSFADPPIVLPELSVEAWAAILPMRGAVEKWFAAGEQLLFNAARDGHVPGWKIVEGRATRTWKDEDAAEARMREIGIDEPFVRKLMSPNQAEEQLHADIGMKKAAAKSLLDAHTERAQGNLSLVRANDKRDAVDPVFDEEGNL